MHRILLAALLSTLTFAGHATAEEDELEASRPPGAIEELARFAGIWEIVKVEPEGAAKDARRLVFRDDWTYAALGADGRELWAGTYDLNPMRTPKVWDHRSHESARKGGDTLGIYLLNGDSLKLACVAGVWNDKGDWSGKDRPESFSLEVADVLLELRRVPAR